MSPDEQDTTVYRVVVNHEEQYSIWPDWKDIPAGWRATGPTGKKDECLAYIKDVWTDMRPLSLRKRMDAAGSGTASAKP
jgi:MbtH protein